MTAKTRGLRVNVTPEMAQRIEAVAEAEAVSTATVIRWALILYLTQRKEQS